MLQKTIPWVVRIAKILALRPVWGAVMGIVKELVSMSVLELVRILAGQRVRVHVTRVVQTRQKVGDI